MSLEKQDHRFDNFLNSMICSFFNSLHFPIRLSVSDEWMVGKVVGWMNGWMDRWIHGWMDGWRQECR